MPLVDPLLVLRGLSGSAPGLRALEEVDLDVHEGDIVGVCGDHGAGTSMLVRLLAGAAIPTAGMIVFEGSRLWRHTPREALGAGIVTIHQDLALVADLSVTQNLFLGQELVTWFGLLDRRAMRREAMALLDRFDVPERDLDRRVGALSPRGRRAVALARAIRMQARLVVIDEPMVGLEAEETAAVLDLIRTLAADGVTVILVGQGSTEMMAVARRIVVLKAGRKAGEAPAAAFTPTSLAEAVATGRVPAFVEDPAATGMDRWVEVPPALVRYPVAPPG